jgi:hypothetical protein
MFKRIRPRARGTAFGIKRRLAHIVVAVTDLEAVATAAGLNEQPTSQVQPTAAN